MKQIFFMQIPMASQFTLVSLGRLPQVLTDRGWCALGKWNSGLMTQKDNWVLIHFINISQKWISFQVFLLNNLEGKVAWEGFSLSPTHLVWWLRIWNIFGLGWLFTELKQKLCHLGYSMSSPNMCIEYSLSTPNDVNLKDWQKILAVF